MCSVANISGTALSGGPEPAGGLQTKRRRLINRPSSLLRFAQGDGMMNVCNKATWILQVGHALSVTRRFQTNIFLPQEER
jgi:hypothetical protein